MCDNHHEVWLTLAQGHLILAQPKKACSVLRKGSEVDSSYWQIWRDLCKLNVFCHNYGDVIQSYQKLLNLKPDYLNMELLRNLAFGILKMKTSGSAIDSGVHEEALKLFSRLMIIHKENAFLWGLFGLVTAQTYPLTDEVKQKTKTYLKYALKCATQPPLWFKTFSSVYNVLDISSILIDVFIQCCKDFDKSDITEDLLKIIYNFTSSILDKVYEYQRDVLTNEVKIQFIMKIAKIEEKLQQVVRI